MSDEAEQIKRVAIIGGGVAGLAMVACLKQMDTGVEEVVLFDSHEDILQYNVGGALALSGGSFILEQIGCLPALKNVALPVKSIVISDGDDELVKIDLEALKHHDPDILCEDAGRGDPLFYSIRWSALRKLLCEYTFRTAEPQEKNMVQEVKEMESSSTETRVHYHKKKKFSYLSESRNKVSIYFTDSSVESDFDLVIGADGIKSLVRNHVFKGNDTILSLIPFMSNILPGTKGTSYTGLRVTQCITPEKHHPHFQDNKAFQTLEKYEGHLHQWIGDGCNVLTLAVGDHQGGTDYVLSTISYEKEYSEQPQNPSWIPEGGNKKDEVKKKLNQAGFHNYHDMHILLDAAAHNDAKIFDVGVRDNVIPYRTWSSLSGKVILIGDSAHTT